MQASTFFDDLHGDIDRHSHAICARIAENTSYQIGTLAQLERAFLQGTETIATAIDRLGARFDYSLGLVLDELHVQSAHLEAIVRQLDSIKRTLQSPLLTQARELYQIGCERLAKGLLDKALKAFLEAETKNDTDFFTEYYLGKLYLYGKDDDDDVLDLLKARDHLAAAARYGKAEVQTNPDFKLLAAEALFHGSVACYALAGEDPALAGQQLAQASSLIKEALHLEPGLSEAWFHAAKYKALQGKGSKSIEILEVAISRDSRYAAKVLDDGAFSQLRPEVSGLLERLRQSSVVNAQAAIAAATNALIRSQEYPFWKSENGHHLHQQAESDVALARDAFATGTYLGFLEATALGQRAHQDAESSLRVRRLAEEEQRVAEQRQKEAAETLRSLRIAKAYAWIGLVAGIGAFPFAIPGPLAIFLGVLALQGLPKEGWEHRSDRLRAGWAIGLGGFGCFVLLVFILFRLSS